MISKFIFLAFSLKNLKRKPFRTAVLLLSIAFLVSLLIFATSFTTSVNSGINRASDRLGADLIIVPVVARDSAEEFLLESKSRSFYMSKDIVDRVKQIEELEGIESITYHTYLSTIAGVCCDIAQTQVVAFDQNTDFILRPWLQKAINRPLARGEAIAGYETGYNLGFDLLDMETNLFNNTFKIVGELDRTGTGLDNALFMTEDDLQQIIDSGNSPLNKGEISIIFTKLKRGADPYYIGKIIEGNIVEVDVVERSNIGREILNTLKDINKIFLVTIVFTSLLTAFLVWAIFSAIANERSREIGIMRAIGANKSHIVRLFILEVFILGLLGSLIGMAAGTYLSLSLANNFELLNNISAGLTLIQHAEIAVAGLLAGTGVCVTGALMPIGRIKKMEPLLAIKEE